MYRVITNDVSDYIYLLVRIAHIFVISQYNVSAISPISDILLTCPNLLY